MRDAPYLTKSSYVRGITCLRLVWLGWHRRLPYEPPLAGSPQAVGTEIGIKAQQLFTGGVLVAEEPWQHDEAVAKTSALMADPDVPAIFEAAFEYAGVRIRADVLERLGEDRWRLCEVKSATKVKATYIDDAAVQVFVIQQSGMDLAAVELVHVNTNYVYRGGDVDWRQFFKRQDISAQVVAEQPGIAEAIAEQLAVLSRDQEPDIEPGPHCPSGCDYWASCTAQKPSDWIFRLPRLSQTKFDALRAQNIERIRDIPQSFNLSDTQDRMRDVVVSGRPYVSSALPRVLNALDGPVAYLDFEAMNPAVPLYQGTRPYQRLVFQWSLHRDDGMGQLTHADYLGDHTEDPREAFIVSLIDALDATFEPIVVYSAYERGALQELSDQFPQHAVALQRIIDRLFDLYVVVRDHVYLEAFNGSLSIKQVGKALAPGFSYDGLEHVADGAQAASAYQRLACGGVADDETATLRAALLAYCRLDTLAMVEAHRGLRALVTTTSNDR